MRGCHLGLDITAANAPALAATVEVRPVDDPQRPRRHDARTNTALLVTRLRAGARSRIEVRAVGSAPASFEITTPRREGVLRRKVILERR